MQLEFNNLTLSDLVQVEKVHDGVYPLPNINNKLYAVQKSIVLDGATVGAAFVHITSEVSLVIYKKLGPIVRMKIILELMKVLINELTVLGLEDTHTFVMPANDEHYAAILERMGFVRAQGIPMYYQKGNEDVQSRSEAS